MKVIQHRTCCADWYNAQGRPELNRQNETHRYFNNGSEKVYNALEAARLKYDDLPQVEPSLSEPAPVKDRLGSIASMFPELDIEERSEGTLGSAPTKPDKSTRTSYKHLVPERDDKAEQELALWCSLQDLSDIPTSIYGI